MGGIKKETMLQLFEEYGPYILAILKDKVVYEDDEVSYYNLNKRDIIKLRDWINKQLEEIDLINDWRRNQNE